MTVEVIHNAGAEASVAAVFQNGGVANSGLIANPSNKKSKEKDSRRRQRKQKKKNSKIPSPSLGKEDGNDSDVNGAKGDVTSGDSAPNQVVEQVEVKYVPEKVDLDDDLLLDFKNVFEMFSFKELEGDEGDDKKDEIHQDAAGKKTADSDSDSDEEEQDNKQKKKGISNKKKKLQRRMKIAELKQICRRPDGVEIWDATASDPKLLVFLKSYRNTVAVPRHWCQKRKYLQGSCCDIHGGVTGKAWY